MARGLLIKIHLYLSAFFAPAIVLVAVSGGLYLLGVKGSVDSAPLGSAPADTRWTVDPSKAMVQDALSSIGVVDFHFDYVKRQGAGWITRPTTRVFYGFERQGEEVQITRYTPSLQKRMMELHMGHGPSAYRQFQKLFAAGMLFIILSGVWLGLSSAQLRQRTAIAVGAGGLVFVLLALG